ALTKYEPYPPEALADRGFLGSWSTAEDLQPGSVLSRYGRPGGMFVSPEGTPFAARGLPPSYEAFGESLYVGRQPAHPLVTRRRARRACSTMNELTPINSSHEPSSREPPAGFSRDSLGSPQLYSGAHHTRPAHSWWSGRASIP